MPPLRPAHVKKAGVTLPAIITAAICGAETTREQTPYLPITADELASSRFHAVPRQRAASRQSPYSVGYITTTGASLDGSY